MHKGRLETCIPKHKHPISDRVSQSPELLTFYQLVPVSELTPLTVDVSVSTFQMLCWHRPGHWHYPHLHPSAVPGDHTCQFSCFPCSPALSIAWVRACEWCLPMSAHTPWYSRQLSCYPGLALHSGVQTKGFRLSAPREKVSGKERGFPRAQMVMDYHKDAFRSATLGRFSSPARGKDGNLRMCWCCIIAVALSLLHIWANGSRFHNDPDILPSSVLEWSHLAPGSCNSWLPR